MRRGAALVALLLAPSAALARPNTQGSTDLYRYLSTDVVESFPSTGGRFKVFFTRAGKNAVDLTDANMNGTPDNVEEVADLYEQVLTFYVGLGFRAPVSDATQSGDHGGDGRFDVYLLDFGGSADGAFRRERCDTENVCSGYLVQENDFAGYAYPSTTYGNRVLASHELFHAVQAAYDDSEGSVLGEGTAVWATERFDKSLSDLEGFVGGYLSRPEHSLDLPLPGPVDPFSYGAGLFFQFLSEKFGDDVIRELWEACAGAPSWWVAIETVLQQHQSGFADAFFTFARWNLFTSKRANPMLGYARGSSYPLVKIEVDPAPFKLASLRLFYASTSYFGVAPAGRARMEASLVVPQGVDGGPLRLALAVRRGNVVAVPVVADASLRLGVDTAGADELIVAVTSTAQSGESLKPGLCVGDTAEVESCRSSLGAVTPMPDMGDTTMPPAPPSGGCHVAPPAGRPPAPSVALALLVGLALASLSLRRR